MPLLVSACTWSAIVAPSPGLPLHHSARRHRNFVKVAPSQARSPSVPGGAPGVVVLSESRAALPATCRHCSAATSVSVLFGVQINGLEHVAIAHMQEAVVNYLLFQGIDPSAQHCFFNNLNIVLPSKSLFRLEINVVETISISADLARRRRCAVIHPYGRNWMKWKKDKTN